jgi:hypothetical protein
MKELKVPLVSRMSSSIKRLTRDVWTVWLVIAFLTTLPYILAVMRTPAGFVFTGVLTAYDDTFAYFAWVQQGKNLQLLMCDPFTSELQPCEFFLPLWSLLGFIARVTGLSIPVTFHIARLFSSFLLLVIAKSVFGLVMKSRARLRYTLWLYATSGGFGWILFGLKSRANLFDAAGSGSVDLDLPEAIAFRSMFAQVHFCVGIALVSGAIALFFSALVEKNASRALIAGVLTSIVAVIHPYMVIVVCGVSAIALLLLPLIRKETNRKNIYYTSFQAAVVFALGVGPGIAYLIYLNRSNEVLREWLRVTDTFSPPVWEFVLGFGLIGVLGVGGLAFIWTRPSQYGRLLSIWIIVQALLLYFPVSFQRRFVEGLQLPLSVAASAALFALANRIGTQINRKSFRRLILISAILFASITNIGFLVGQIAGRGGGTGANDPRRYLSNELMAGFDWLRENSAPGAVLFASYMTGNVAPSTTGMRVFLGHYAQTLRSDEKGPLVTQFYSNTASDDEIRKVFAEHRVRYVIYGPFERALSNAFMPAPWLRLAYRAGDVMIFELPDQAYSPDSK